MGRSNRTLPVVWLGRVNRFLYPRIKCIKYRNLNQVTRAETYLLIKMEGFVEKNNAASWVTALDLWKWYFRRSLMMSYPKKWLEQFDVSRMVDIDILMQIWKNRVGSRNGQGVPAPIDSRRSLSKNTATSADVKRMAFRNKGV
ncbi:hypothetical protein TNCV_2611061 [Trichonephila clavipes]|nr:hypothetical protein TNCV_2611061 [Trichonephila clavipes]